MELDIKYRIVKCGKNYAIQKGGKVHLSSYKNFKEQGCWQRVKNLAHSFCDFRWWFLEPSGKWGSQDEDIEYIGPHQLHLCICSFTRVYKTKKVAQDALKQHLWDTMVEPIDGQEEWKQVNKD